MIHELHIQRIKKHETCITHSDDLEDPITWYMYYTFRWSTEDPITEYMYYTFIGSNNMIHVLHIQRIKKHETCITFLDDLEDTCIRHS